jgi:hypothetical protein
MATVILVDYSYISNVQRIVARAAFRDTPHVGIDFSRFGSDLIKETLPEGTAVSEMRIFWAIPHVDHAFHMGAQKIRSWFEGHPTFLHAGSQIPVHTEWGHLQKKKRRVVLTRNHVDQMFSRGELSENMISMLIGKSFEIEDEIQKGVDSRIVLAIADAIASPDIDHIVLIAADSDFLPAIDRATRAKKKVTVGVAVDPDLGMTLPIALNGRCAESPDLVRVQEITRALLAMNREYDPSMDRSLRRNDNGGRARRSA